MAPPAAMVLRSAEKAMSFKASRGKRSNGLVRARRPISCSSVIESFLCGALAPPTLREKFVPARVGDEQTRVSGVGFDLLTQPIDMRLQRMGRPVRIVAPDFLQ